MGDEEAVLFANDRFYIAFTARDIKAMEELWATSGVICVHPGWQPLYGREEVLESWQAILGEEGAPAVKCRVPHATLHGDTAIVICIEELDGAFLCATNVFVREDGDWHMAHHHAGPVHMDESDLPEEPDVAVN
ncbi:MAG: nuclear transport factor 2 family protein [Rhodospirillaceae bacterium]|jgi:ketosteroid isomerase-like protein|nr:nuclear transport factor 2 family protein [Rhodospirillaceae bacterium]